MQSITLNNTPHTCGVCEIICDPNEIVHHEYLEGFLKFTVDENLYFYPMTEDDQIVRRSALDNDNEAIIVEPNHNKNLRTTVNTDNQERTKSTSQRKSAKQSALTFDEEEQLVLEVRERRPLWDYTTPLKERSPNTTKSLWNEVAQALNGKISAEVTKKKFKNLVDTYRRILVAEARPSGSARLTNKKKWPHYESMEFMRDSLLMKKTETSMNETLEIADDSNELPDDQSSQASSCDNSRKRKNSESERLEILSKIAGSLATPIPSLVLPPPPQRQEDEISAFLEFQGYRLRTMNERKRKRVMQMIFNIVNEDDS